MHCPRCGQKQASGNLKFCNKCGLPLGLVYELVNNGGSIPGAGGETKARWFTRRNGLGCSGMWFIFFTLFMTSMMGVMGDGDVAGVAAIIGVFGAIAMAVASLVFLPGKQKNREYVNPAEGYVGLETGTPAADNVLGAGNPTPAEDFTAPAGNWKAPDTGDLVTPGSVTEGTTRLLNKDDEQEK